MKRLLLLLGASAVVTFVSLDKRTLAATVTAAKVGNEFEDSDTDAVVIDAIENFHEGEGSYVAGIKDEGSRSLFKGISRNERQFFSYIPLMTESLSLPGISENGNEMDATSTPAHSSCITNQGRKGNCLQFEECFPLLNLPEDKYGNGTNYSSLQEELYEITADRKCSSIVHTGKSKFSNVCCDLPQKDKTVSPIVEFYNSNPLSDDESMTNSSMIPKYTKVVNTWATCGEKQFDMKIIGGQETIPHEYPWMVIMNNKYTTLQNLPGGLQALTRAR